MMVVLAFTLAVGLAFLARGWRVVARDAESIAALALALGAAVPWPYGLVVALLGLAGGAWIHVARARVERQALRALAERRAAAVVRADRPARKTRPPVGVRARFMAAMGHELRSPLNSISGFAQLLEDGSDGPLNDAQLENVVLVRRAADELITLLTDILDAARIEAGRIRLERAWIAPVEVLTLALERERGESETERAVVEVQVQPGLSPLFVDRARLGQAVFNVLRAVVRGRAAIHARVRETTEAGRPVVRFELYDRGTPISATDAARAFDPDPAARPQGRSLALGLALSVARDLAQLHGGGARAEPLDGGTNWMLWVPAEISDEPAPRRARVPARGIRRPDQR